MTETIEITISPDGQQVTIEGKHIEGPDCAKLTKELEDALGTVSEKHLKPEYHRTGVVRRSRTR